tara:strand:+ start:180 stop:494 length:315 start_codon:yes stop_codon:yes gene_type:complete
MTFEHGCGAVSEMDTTMTVKRKDIKLYKTDVQWITLPVKLPGAHTYSQFKECLVQVSEIAHIEDGGETYPDQTMLHLKCAFGSSTTVIADVPTEMLKSSLFEPV